MVKKFLKIAGVKSEAEFYNKYPSEKAFFKAHPEARDLKKYRQGGQQKKLNQLISYQGDIDNLIPMAQDGRVLRAANAEFSCGSHPRKELRRACEERYNVGGLSKKEIRALEDELAASNLKGLVNYDDYYTLKNIAEAHNSKMGRADKAYSKMFDLNTGELLPTATGMKNEPELRATTRWYKGRTDITPFDVYQGIFKDYNVTGAQTPKQASEWLNKAYEAGYAMPKAQTTEKQAYGGYTPLVNPEGFPLINFGGDGAGAIANLASGMAKKGKKVKKAQIGDNLGLSNPLGGSMPNPAASDPNYGYMYGTVGGIGTQPAVGGQLPAGAVVPDQNIYTMDPWQTGTFEKQVAGSQGAVNPKKKFDPTKLIGPAQQIIGGIKQIKEQKKAEKEANKQFQLSGLVSKAAKSRKEPIRRQYDRPEDALIQPNELFPTYGVGTNYIAEDGAEVTGQIGGNETEIQNMYNPYNLFRDLGYEPLDESEQIKQYQMGGSLFSADQVGSIGSQIGAMVGGAGQGKPAGWSQVLGGAGSLLGPVGSIIGGSIGGIIDGRAQAKLRDYQNKTTHNMVNTAMQQGIQNIQGGYGSFMEDGGYVSHDWQPQVIASFGGNRVSNLLRPDPMMDTLRTGGHITENEMGPEDMGPVTSMALGGELKTHWGGYAEPISYNPYLPDGGETVMFRGNSHSESDGKGNTGIGVTYGDNPVEVERREPAVKLRDGGTGEDNMVVYGNLKIPNQYLSEIGDPKAKGKKFKHYVTDLSKQEAKHNKTIAKNFDIIDQMDDITSFDQMKFFSAKANIDGANMKLRQIAEYKMNAAAVQNAINEAAEESGLDADALAKGKFKLDKTAMDEAARWGRRIRKSQNGSINPKDYGEYADDATKKRLDDMYNAADKETDPKKKKELTLAFQKEFHKVFPKTAAAIIKADPNITAKAKQMGIKDKTDLLTRNDDFIRQTNEEGWFGDRTKQYHAISSESVPEPVKEISIPPPPSTSSTSTTQYPISVYNKGTGLIDIANQLIPYFRPSDQEALDPSQLYGEMYALATNQVEPVQAQTFQPLLEQPYDISLQDQLNANQADFNAMLRQNPEAASQLSAQKYAANSKVLADQFRANQEMKAGVYNRNRQTLNQAKLQNLGILDQQMVRQETAKSRTKEVGQAALNSISDKIAKNKLDNRTLSIYENLYNYRYDKSGRAINMNPLYRPTIPQISNQVPIYDNNGNVIGYQATSTPTTPLPPLPPLPSTSSSTNTGQTTTGSQTTQRNGGKTSTMSRNRDILRAMKGL